jgi:hypothetical protein
LSLRASLTQHLRRKGAARLLVTASCSNACALLVTGIVTATTHSKRGHRATARTLLVVRVPAAKLRAGKPTKLTITLTAAARRALVNALASKHQLSLTLSGRASVPGMSPGTASVTIRLVV